jgi:GcrA cell cycle regulator
MATESKWTDERVEQLRKLHADRLSCSMMAIRIGCGFSRNAIIGKLNRLGLSNAFSNVHKDNPRPPKQKRVNRKTIHIVKSNGNSNGYRVMESAETDLQEMRCVEVIPRAVSLLELQSRECRFPYGDGPFTFCGHPVLEGRSYCGSHVAVSRSQARPISPEVQEQRRRTLRANYKLALVGDAA